MDAGMEWMAKQEEGGKGERGKFLVPHTEGIFEWGEGPVGWSWIADVQQPV